MPSPPQVKDHQVLTHPCALSLSPKPLSLWGLLGEMIDLKFQIALLAWATSSPILLVIHVEVGVGEESHSTIPYYPWTFPPLPISPLPNPTFHFPSHILKGRNAQERQTQEPSSPKTPQGSQAVTTPLAGPPPPLPCFPVLSLPCILTSCHPHALVGAPVWTSNPIHFPSTSAHLLTISLPDYNRPQNNSTIQESTTGLQMKG